MVDQGEYHLVRRSRGEKPYIRRRPFTYQNPSEAQRKMREEFAKVAKEHGKGKKSLVTIEKGGALKDIPRSAEPIMKALKEKRTKTPGPLGDTPPER